MMGKPLLFVCACCTFAVSALGSGCSLQGGKAPYVSPSAEFADQFQVVRDAGSSAPESDFLLRHFPVTRRGRRLDTLTLKAPVAVRALLTGFTGNCTLKLMAVQPFNVGDGLELNVALEGDGRNRVIYNRYFDAGRTAADRDWIPLEIPFDLAGLTDPHLEIRITAGPQGDLDADWLALAELQILQEGARR